MSEDSEKDGREDTGGSGAPPNARHLSGSRCLEVMLTGNENDLWDLLPQIGVLRDERFFEPLLDMLTEQGTKREFAVLGLSALRNSQGLEPLFTLLAQICSENSGANHPLILMILHAVGEIGSDLATPLLMDLFKKGGEMEMNPECRALLVESLGRIAQQGGTMALETLLDLGTSEDPDLCAQALPELAVAFWHRPNQIPERVMRLILDRLDDHAQEIRSAALSALESLADVGCKRAEEALSRG